MTQSPKQSAGFTLLELMTTLSVAAILLAIAAPSFTDIIRNNRLTAAANDLQRSAQVARAEAVKRQLPVVVCASGNAQVNTPTCNDGDFTQWIVFVDTDNDWVRDNLEPILDRHVALDPSITVHNDGSGIVSYGAAGFAQPAVAGGKVPTTRIVLCDARGNQQVGGGDNSAARAMLIEAAGRTRITRARNEVADAIAIANPGGCP